MQERAKIATLTSRVGKGVIQDHFLVGVAKYTRYISGRTLYDQSEMPQMLQQEMLRMQAEVHSTRGAGRSSKRLAAANDTRIFIPFIDTKLLMRQQKRLV